MKPKRITDWTRLGRTLRSVDPGRFELLLEAAQKIIGIHTDPPREDAPIAPPAPRQSASERRALKRRAAFRVIDGGLAKGSAS